MLEAVGIGVAMGNAKDEVKAKADFVCQSVENDGIYHYCCLLYTSGIFLLCSL